MDPLTLIVAALVNGAAAAAKDVGGEAVKNAYSGFKTLIVRKFGSKASVEAAIAGVEPKSVEKKPVSESRKDVLKEELEVAGADKDAELLKQAQALIELLEKNRVQSGVSYAATNTGSGAIAQGPGAIAGGQGSIVAGGNVSGIDRDKIIK
jgi:hypothetical protein